MSKTLDSTLLDGLCIISRMALGPEATIKQMVREPAQNPQDSGWRFLAGEETEEYMEEPANFVIREIAEVVSADPSISAHLDAPVFHFFARNSSDDEFTAYSSRKPVSQRVFTVLFLAVFILGVLYSGISLLLYWPPYAWIADLQVSMFGGHLPFLSFFLGMVVMSLAVFAVAIPAHVVITRFAARGNTPWIVDVPQFPEAIFPGRRPLPGDSPAMRRIQTFNRFAAAIIAIVVGLGFVGYGLFKWTVVPDAIEPMTATIDDLRNHGMPSVSYVRLEATPLWDQEVRHGSGSGIAHYFVPFATTNSDQSSTYLVILKVSKYSREDAYEQDHFQGILTRDGMPGEVAGIFKSRGIHAPQGHLVLEDGLSPEDAVVGAFIGVGLGGFFAFIGLVMGLAQWFRERRSCQRRAQTVDAGVR